MFYLILLTTTYLTDCHASYLAFITPNNTGFELKFYQHLEHVNSTSNHSIEIKKKRSVIFNASDLVITRNLSSTTHPHLSQCIASVVSSEPERTLVILLQEETDLNSGYTAHSFYQIMVPTHALRKLSYNSDPTAYQNRNKLFPSKSDIKYARRYHLMITKILELRLHPNDLINHLHLQLLYAAAFRWLGAVLAFELTESATHNASKHIDFKSIIARYTNPVSSVSSPSLNGVIRHGDIVLIKELKKQNNPEKQMLANRMSHSIGTIMQNVSRINNHSQTEFRIQSIVDPHTIGLRRIYFDKLTKIYFFDVSNFDMQSNQSHMIDELLTDPSNDVLYLPIRLNSEIAHLIFLPIPESNHYVTTSLSSYLYGAFRHLHGHFSRGLCRDELMVLMNTMHIVIDRNAFNEAMDALLVRFGNTSTVHEIGNWSSEIKQMYETNYNRHNGLTNIQIAQISRRRLVFRDVVPLWRLFLETLCDIYGNTLANIVSARFGTKWNFEHRGLDTKLLFYDIWEQYLVSNKLGRDLHVFYTNTPNTVDITSQYRMLFAFKINNLWNINNMKKANLLSQHLIKAISNDFFY